MNDNPFSLWVYLSQSPLLWLTVTLLVYAIADAVSLATRRHPLANPVLHSIWILGAFLLVTGTSYPTYFAGAQFVHFLLGPATVALAVPLYENRALVAAAILPMLVALVVGSVTAIVSVVVLSELAGLPREVILSLAPKSVTAGVAMGISESLGADPSLTGGCRNPHGHHGRDCGHAADEPRRHHRFPRPRLCRWSRRPWHRHRPRLSGRRDRWRVLRDCHEPERADHLAPGAARGDIVDALIPVAVRFCSISMAIARNFFYRLAVKVSPSI
jgi:hypothetical protein